MKKKIIILGSTGSVCKTTLSIIKDKRTFFFIDTLLANKNYKKICFQIINFKPKNFVVINKKIFLKVKKRFLNKNINIYNSYKNLQNTKKVDITVAAIPGIEGLEPTIFFARRSKKILLANKESVICGWKLIEKLSKTENLKIVPIDSEHFSIHNLIQNYKKKEIDKIFITASGGPFLKTPLNKFKNIKIKDALKHPKWSMGKKISIDSATLMNKILELIEAKKIFNFKYSKFKIIIHPQSLVHAIVRFKNGITKFLYHKPDMVVPISNAIFDNNMNLKDFTTKQKTDENIESLFFENVDEKRFPIIKIVPKLNSYVSAPIIINAANEILVDHFLKKKISFISITKYIFLLLADKNYKKYAIRATNNLKNIYAVDKWSRNTTLEIIRKHN